MFIAVTSCSKGDNNGSASTIPTCGYNFPLKVGDAIKTVKIIKKIVG